VKLGTIIWKKILVKGFGIVAVAVIAAIPFVENMTAPDTVENTSNQVLSVLDLWTNPLDHTVETTSNPNESAIHINPVSSSVYRYPVSSSVDLDQYSGSTSGLSVTRFI
jgi:hypothetical protein